VGFFSAYILGQSDQIGQLSRFKKISLSAQNKIHPSTALYETASRNWLVESMISIIFRQSRGSKQMACLRSSVESWLV
jgi:hypothetical protein